MTILEVGINHPKKAAAYCHHHIEKYQMSGNDRTNTYQENPKPRGRGRGSKNPQRFTSKHCKMICKDQLIELHM